MEEQNEENLLTKVENTTENTTEKNAKKPFNQTRKFYILGFILGLIILAIITFISMAIPSTKVTKLGIYNDHIQWSKFAFWNLMLITGFSYVACINNHRKNPFKGRGNRGYSEFFKLILIAQPLFWIAPIFVIAGKNDPDDPFNLLPRSYLSLVAYNFFSIALFYLIGLQFTHLDTGILHEIGNLVVFPKKWKLMNWKHILTVFIILIVILVFISVQFYFYFAKFTIPPTKIWLSSWFGGIILIILISFLLRKTHETHLHHYFIFGYLMIFNCHFHPISSISMGYCAGVFTEGISTWFVAPIWKKYRV
ncbi:lccl domain protein [Anaeramoeba ignava]|uniref:Lccl domain protein n=1 Tax=Anaeramoeba ignava TaxID=1746090 RepID=A0A9Q0LBD4_ANAIG|nr:lccl domain protein [Anaeramoeba ignava]